MGQPYLNNTVFSVRNSVVITKFLKTSKQLEYKPYGRRWYGRSVSVPNKNGPDLVKKGTEKNVLISVKISGSVSVPRLSLKKPFLRRNEILLLPKKTFRS